MKFEIITIFPCIFESYFKESIINRALKKKIIKINIHNLRQFTTDKHRTVDGAPYGGGAGMILKVEPIFKCVQFLKSKIKKSKKRIILFSAKGKCYTQKEAKRLAKYNNLILICGRYEGVDERVAKYIADEEISVGEYILTGGEIPAMILIDSITRLLPRALGNPFSLKEESFVNCNLANQKTDSEEKFLEYPHYTRPENFYNWKVPRVLLSGNHQKINDWKKKNSSKIVIK